MKDLPQAIDGLTDVLRILLEQRKADLATKYDVIHAKEEILRAIQDGGLSQGDMKLLDESLKKLSALGMRIKKISKLLSQLDAQTK